MRQISGSVGLRGVNRKEDVRTIQELLNLVRMPKESHSRNWTRMESAGARPTERSKNCRPGSGAGSVSPPKFRRATSPCCCFSRTISLPSRFPSLRCLRLTRPSKSAGASLTGSQRARDSISTRRTSFPSSLTYRTRPRPCIISGALTRHRFLSHSRGA
jgi:hypothetical protein